MIQILNRLAGRQVLLPVVTFVLAGIVSFGIIYAATAGNRTNQEMLRVKCKDTCVTLYEDKASPNTIALAVGSYVQFNSADGKSHNLSLGEGGSDHNHKGKFHSGEFKADEGWKVQFNEEGSFYFHDHLNPKINVLIVVYVPGKNYEVR